MRWIYLAIIILFAAAAIIFAVQNLEIVTMTFLGIDARVPLALLGARQRATACSRCYADPTKDPDEVLWARPEFGAV